MVTIRRETDEMTTANPVANPPILSTQTHLPSLRLHRQWSSPYFDQTGTLQHPENKPPSTQHPLPLATAHHAGPLDIL